MVQLMPMTENEFNDFRKAAVEEYAQDHVNAGNWDPAEALQKSEQEFQELLPQGIASPDQHLFSIVDDAGAKVGMLWFAVRYKGSQPYAFVYDFMIDEPFRRKGYGRQASPYWMKKPRNWAWPRSRYTCSAITMPLSPCIRRRVTR